MRGLGIVGGIAATAWVSANVVLVGVAVSLFTSLRRDLGEEAGNALAGRVFGDLLAWWAIAMWIPFGVLALAVVWRCGIAWSGGRRVAPALALLGVLLLAGTHAYGQHLITAVAERRDALPPGTTPSEDPTFQALHRRSERTVGFETLLVLLAGCLLPLVRPAPEPEDDRGW